MERNPQEVVTGDPPTKSAGSLAALFAAQAAAGPQRVALELRGAEITYRELDRRSQRLAHLLRSRGVGAGAMVGLCFERGLELPLAILAVIKAGAAYVPLDAGYPAERLHSMIADSGITLVLGSAREMARLPPMELDKLVLEELAAELTRQPTTRLPDHGGGLMPALVMFTSGSTGRPKGVVVHHAAICRLVRGQRYELGAGDVLTQISNPSFDAYTFELWGALLNGGRVLILDRETLLDPRAFAAALADRDIAAMLITVSLFSQMVLDEPRAFVRVRHLFFGGEACEPSIVRRALANKPAHLHNGYGPTECTTLSTFHEVEQLAAEGNAVPIGKPIRGTEAWLFGPHGEAACEGEEGELYLGGEGLALGYWRRPALTAKAFVPHPASAQPGARLYRTGDLARRLPSGDLEFLGRVDFQVKVRGFRIELGEVEAVLGRHPAVREKIALTQGTGRDQRLIAFVTVARGEEDEPLVTAGELQDFCAGRLAAFSLPQVVLVEKMPLTPNGKIDRRALPQLETATAASHADFEAPRSESERQVAAAFGALLGQQNVGREADFFALGGHSLKASRLLAKIGELCGVKLPVGSLFAAPTVASLAALVDEQVAAGSRGAPLPPAATSAEQVSELSPAQQRLFFLHRFDPHSAVYNLPAAWTLEGRLDLRALERSLQEIEKRHEVLRSRFQEREGVGGLSILPPAPFALEVVDPGARSLRSVLRELAAESFDLLAEKPWRARLITLGEQEHVLFVSVHHIAFDGLSLVVFENELAAFYRHFSRGDQSVPAPLVWTYRDHAASFTQRLPPEELARQLEFWRGRLSAEPLELPTDFARPQVPTFRGGTLEHPLDASLVRALEEIGRRQGATPFLTFLAPFQMLLARLSGQRRIQIGVPFSGRRGAEEEALIGFFVNTLVLASEFSADGNDNFTGRLPRLREELAQIYAHQDLPFDRLVEGLGVPRDASRNPLFQVAFQVFDVLRPPSDFGGELEASRYELPLETARFDLELRLERVADGGLRIVCQYAADLFAATTVKAWLELYESVLRQILAAPSCPLSRLDLLRPADRALYAAVNDTRSDYPREASLAEIFAAQVAAGPQRIALELRGEQVSYGELDLMSNRLAHLLRSRGVRPGAMVGLCFERGLELPLAILAVVKTGAAYVPLDGDYPAARLAGMVEDTALALLLGSARQIARLPDLGIEKLALEELELELAACPSTSLPFFPGGLAPALTIFTSGSTGRPKGVVVPQRAVCRLLIATNYIDLQPEDVVVQASAASFDVYTFEIWGAFLHGGRLLVIDRETLLDPRSFAAAIEGREIAALFLTVALFTQMILEQPRAFTRVRHLMFGGEACEPSIARRALTHPPAHLQNGYGPAECTTYATTFEVREVAPDAISVPIGKPIANTEALVLDRFGQPAPVGVAGELCLGGEGLALGYWRRPALTAQAFVPHPASPVPGARLYRTGDLARLLPSGDFDYLGRIDFQVKVRGYRIELGEVEAVLGRHPAVREKIALTQGKGRDQRLVAFVVVDHGQDGKRLVEAAELQRFAAETLPAFALPLVHLLDHMPLGPNGKIDRQALPLLSAAELQGPGEHVAPRSPLEQEVAAAFGEILGAEKLGVEADFFALGGHSLLATRLLAAVARRTGIEAPLPLLFKAPTVGEFAAAIAALPAERHAAPSRLRRAEAGGEKVLSFAQERLLFLHRLDPASVAYNLPAAYRLRGRLDPNALHRALSLIEERQEVLRTRFREQDGIARPEILPAGDLELPRERVTVAALEARLAQLARTSFDLRREKPWRVRLLEIADEDNVLFVNVHHIAFDGLSFAIFEQELAAWYTSEAEPEPLALAYTDYAQWQKEWLRGAELERQLAFWRPRLSADALELPTDRPRPPLPSYRGGSLVRLLGAEMVGRIEEIGRRHGATPFLTFLAPFQMLLARLSGQRRVSVGVPFAGRHQGGVDGLLGFFVNTLVLSADFGDDPTLLALLPRLREEFTQVYAHQDVPFEKLVEELGESRDASRNPLFQVAFQLFEVPRQPAPFGGLEIKLSVPEMAVAKFDLEILLERLPDGGLAAHTHYAADLFAEATVAGWLELYEILLRQVASAPELPLSRLPLLRPADRALYAAGNDNASDFPRELSLAEIFAAQAAAGPQRIALELRGRTMSYGELDLESNRLAHLLRSRGVRPGDMVGLCFERGLELPLAILAVVKAGAAYVPLDGDYPEARLRAMAEDTALALLLAGARQIARLPALGMEMLALEELEGELASCPSSPLPFFPGGLAPAVTIFTSGSTGRPKGVVVTQRAICRLLIATNYIDLQPEDVVVQVSAASFDVYTFEIWGAFLHGGRLLVIDRETLLDPRAFAAALAGREIAALFLTVALLTQMMLEEPAAFTRVRHLMFGGEACEPSVARRALAHRPAHLQNGYGPAECTTYATTYDVLSLAEDAGSVPIGKPVANTEVLVLDRFGQPASVGVHGELCLGGEGLALGYWRRPALTAQAFVPHPASPVPGARLYRTGDLARLLPSGDFDYLGRIDFQVKVRGYRIELGEVEAVLGRHPAVREKIALTQGKGRDQSLVAFVVVRRGADGEPLVSAQELQRFAAEILPTFAVPRVHLLAVMPLTPNGKIDRRALPLLGTESTRDETKAELRTETERRVARAFAETLAAGAGGSGGEVDAAGLGPDDDFFALGGHSLLATRLMAKVREYCHVDVPVRILFTAPTLSAFAGEVETLRRESGRAAASSADEGGKAEEGDPEAGPGRISFAQQRLLFLHRFDPYSAVYNVPAAFTLRGLLDQAALRLALGRLEQRQEVLRTRFREEQGLGYFEVLPASPFLELAAENVRPQDLSSRLEELAAHPFDLLREKPWRVHLLALVDPSTEDAAASEAASDAADYVLLVNVHHIAFDGLSLHILQRELAALYRAACRGEEPRLPALPWSFRDYAAWQRSWLRGEDLAQQLAFWRTRLGAEPLELPTDRPRPPIAAFEGAAVSRRLDAALVQQIEELGRGHGASPFLAFLAPFQTLLARLSGQERVNVGVPFSGRHGGEVENLLGFFINTLVLSADFADDPSFEQLLRRLRQDFGLVYAHQDVPFEKLVEELGVQRDPSRNPLFQVAFQLFEKGGEAIDFGNLEVEPRWVEVRAAKFDLDVALERLEDGGLRVGAFYAKELFDESTVAGWLELYEILLRLAAASPSLPLSRFELLRPADRALYAAVNDNATGFPRDSNLLEVFAARVEEGPERIAGEFRGETLTYAELDHRTNRLARRLQQQGVLPGSMVGVCIERSLELVVAILAIVKTGSAYVPLDADYPAERLAGMVQDTRMPLLLAGATQLGRLPEIGTRILALAQLEDEARALSGAGLPRNPAFAESAANVIFTSGSTGRPKGVVVTQRGVLRLVRQTNYMDLQPGDVVVQVSSSSFDVYTFELWGALMNAGHLLVVDRDTLLHPKRFAAALEGRDIAALFLTVTLFGQMVHQEPRAFTRVRHLFFGGEACEPSVVRKALENPPTHLQNGYGPTECTCYATVYEVPEMAASARSVPIGKPVANTEVLVLDRYGNVAPVGVHGELCLGGDGLAWGYWQRPALTARTFVPHPSSRQPGARLYRTGDLARLLPTGDFDYLGRIDFQVKVRGFRIELGEIEAVLGRHEAVREKIALTRGQGADQLLVAFVVPQRNEKGEAMVSAAELQRYCAEHLPSFAVPLLRLLEVMPTTPNGKIDRRALPQHDLFGDGEGSGEASEPPRDALERLVAEAWEEVLVVSLPGREADFFSLGGHSLAAMRILSVLHENLGAELPLPLLFSHPRLADFAAAAREELAGSEEGRELLASLAEIDAMDASEREELLSP